jgi:hypothetical protein
MIMSNALWIAAQDLREQSRLFLVAVVLACMPFLATLLPSTRGRAQDVILIVGSVVSLAMGLGLALGLGMSTFGRPLTERRMSFWFAKPVSSAALWVGKLLAGLLTSIVCFAIIFVPSALFAGSKALVLRYGEAWKAPTLLITGILGLYLVGHAISTMVRSRSVLLAFDLIGVLATFAVLALVIRPLLFSRIFDNALVIVAALFLVVLAVAPYWQLENGRADVRRSHAALSRAIWTGFGIVLLVAGAAVAWLVSADPRKFDQVLSIQQSPAGNAAFISGSAPYRRGLDATHVLSADGTSTRVPLPPFWWGITFSRDGRYAAWIEPGLFQWSRGTLVVRDLEAKTNHPMRGEYSLVSNLVFSDKGERLAIRDGATLSILDRESERVLAAMKTTGAARYSFWFVTPDVLRYVHALGGGRGPIPMLIGELDVRMKKVTQTGMTSALPRYQALSVSGDGSRMFLRAEGRILDGRTGAEIAKIGKDGETHAWSSSMLSDGRVIASHPSAKITTLTVYSRDGERLREIQLPSRVWIVGERTDGTLLCLAPRAHAEKHTAEGNAMYLVDVNRGAVVKTLQDTKGPGPQFSPDPRLPLYKADAKLAAVNGEGKVVYWN